MRELPLLNAPSTAWPLRRLASMQAREVFQCPARFRLLFTGQADPTPCKEGACLGDDVKGFLRSALRRQFEDARPVGIEPHFRYQHSAKIWRHEFQLQAVDRSECGKRVEVDA